MYIYIYSYIATDKSRAQFFLDLHDNFCAPLLFLMSGRLLMSANFSRIIIIFSCDTFFRSGPLKIKSGRYFPDILA